LTCRRQSLCVVKWPAHWEPQEEGMMSIAASFPSVKKPRFNIILGEERQWWLKVMLASLWQQWTIYIWRLVQALRASCNVKPAHTQPSTLLPTYDDVVKLTGLLETKVMSVSSGKQ
jgi:hypothetical protein